MAPPYASRDEFLAVASLDSQAKLTHDPLRQVLVGTGDGTATKFPTPFVRTTTFKGFVAGVPVTPDPTVSRGTGTGSCDEVVFAAAPTLGAAVTITADSSAANAEVLDRALQRGADTINGYLHALLPITDPALLDSLRAKNCTVSLFSLRGRRNLDVVDPLEMEWKAAMRWLELVAEGKIPVSSGSSSTAAVGEFVSGGFTPVYSDPDEEISL